jgi:CRISPR-associated protein Cas1
MKRLLNTLYINQPDCYLCLERENLCVRQNEEQIAKLPLLNLENIVSFSRSGASPALMEKCAQMGIGLCFMSQSGRFLARVEGAVRGNLLLRKAQYRISDSEELSAAYAAGILQGKLYNTRWVLERAARDHEPRLDAAKLKESSAFIAQCMRAMGADTPLEELRGLEGKAAAAYFAVFDELILCGKPQMAFTTRNRRPPTDPVNAMLSFAYALLANDCRSAIEGVGLDPYAGFLHRDRPGRASLALDIMEELRACFADRFVLSVINRRELNPSDFKRAENGSVRMKDEARKSFLSAWQQRKKESITHPFLKEKIEWGLVPHAQALLLARTIRGDLDSYPPFMWK